jgi:hypothetical protein
MACCCCDEKTASASFVMAVGAAIFIWYNLHAIFVLFVVLAAIGYSSLAISLVIMFFMRRHLRYLWVRRAPAIGDTVPYRVEAIQGGQDGRSEQAVEAGSPGRLPRGFSIRRSTPAEIEAGRTGQPTPSRREPLRVRDRLR